MEAASKVRFVHCMTMERPAGPKYFKTQNSMVCD